MKRREFIRQTGAGLGGIMMAMPAFGNPVHESVFMEMPITVQQKKQLADVALNTAKTAGANYADVRIGRYLNQFISTRENKVLSIADTESLVAASRTDVRRSAGARVHRLCRSRRQRGHRRISAEARAGFFT